MDVTASRRLPGPSLWLDGPGAVADVLLAEDEQDPVPAWRAALKRANAALGWPRRAHSRRSGDLFIALAIEAPPDCLAGAARLNDWAITGGLEDELPALVEQVAAAGRPERRAAVAEAGRRELPWLLDESGLTIGLGAGAVTVVEASEGSRGPSASHPRPGGRTVACCEEIPWEDLHGIPVVVVTGTTGTTATARLLARIATQAGHAVGLACRVGIEVGGKALAFGNLSGPAATRLVLRDPRVTFAVLEAPVADILAEGLVLSRADFAVVTGITSDPPGDHGVTTRQHLAEVALVVAKAARHLILNADDPLLAEHGAGAWFSLEHRVEGAWVEDGELVCGDLRVGIDRLPELGRDAASDRLTVLLAAVTVARAAGLPVEATAEALASLSLAPGSTRGPDRLAQS